VTSVLQTAAAFNDPSRHLEVYHETAHLWHVTGKAPAPRWEEGLATYLQLLLAERLDDRSVLEKRLSDIEQRYRRTLEDDRTLATVAMADYGRDRMTGHAYRVGALMFYALHRLVGDDQFGEIVGGYRRDFADGDGSSEAFAEHANRITTVDLDIFFDYWLFGAGWAEALMRGRTVDDFIRSYGEHAKGG